MYFIVLCAKLVALGFSSRPSTYHQSTSKAHLCLPAVLGPRGTIFEAMNDVKERGLTLPLHHSHQMVELAILLQVHHLRAFSYVGAWRLRRICNWRFNGRGWAMKTADEDEKFMILGSQVRSPSACPELASLVAGASHFAL